MTEPFDAVLAEMLGESTLFLHEITDYHTRLAAAHAAELAERDARIALLQKECQTRAEDYATLTAMWVKDEAEYRARAEAAERDARELRAILYEAVGDDAKDWESGDGWPMGRFLVPALAGDYATAASEFAAYNAERAAIATTEQAATGARDE